MAKVLAVIGATGQQGSAIIDFVLRDAELSSGYKLRAITRDVNSSKAKGLAAKNVEVVHGDVMDQKSLGNALAGAHTLFAMTNAAFTAEGLKVEYATGKQIADVAVQQKVQYIIFSSLPNVTKLSNGKYKHAFNFDAKAKIEEYIRSLPKIQSSFIMIASFMENFSKLPLLRPHRAEDGTYVLSSHLPCNAKRPYVDVRSDLGKFVGNILAKPDEYAGRSTVAAVKNYSLEEQAQIMSRTAGKTVVYKQISQAEWRARLPHGTDVLESVLSFAAEFGHFGPDTEELIKFAVEHARGSLTTLEEHFRSHPLKLD